jgi:hypothetical protein
MCRLPRRWFIASDGYQTTGRKQHAVLPQRIAGPMRRLPRRHCPPARASLTCVGPCAMGETWRFGHITDRHLYCRRRTMVQGWAPR